MWDVIPAAPELSNPVLPRGESYQGNCTPNVEVNKMKSVKSSFSDLVVEQDADAHWKVDVGDNEVKCEPPKKWACFTLTCNVFVSNIRVHPVRQTHCYIDAKVADLTYTNVEGLSLGETVTCSDSATIFMSDDAGWNGFTLRDKRSALVPRQVQVGTHLIGCELRSANAWTRKAYKLPIIGRPTCDECI
ncbi:unnamed protein product [Dibothriocephalus latus]|uniref:Uncharacterized protein n=1 Tax=Dibothriocephalus latus TaxID=60516 RepID=A0A3P7LMW3_DIBLA|nr:unnamed protein product [Dibothriocephalus latus]